MAMFDDRGFYKRAQIVAARPRARRRRARSRDLDRLTIFADNLVPHVLRCDGVLVYDAAPRRAHRRRAPAAPGPQEREIRAVRRARLRADRRAAGVSARELDHWLWNRGQAPEYKARPRHRCRTVYY